MRRWFSVFLPGFVMGFISAMLWVTGDPFQLIPLGIAGLAVIISVDGFEQEEG